MLKIRACKTRIFAAIPIKGIGAAQGSAALQRRTALKLLAFARELLYPNSILKIHEISEHNQEKL